MFLSRCSELFWNLRPKVIFGCCSCIQIVLPVHLVMDCASFKVACGITSATSTTAMSAFRASPIRSTNCA
ncbi:hypothetical protein D3C72_2363900 [compost metagenome]